MKKIVLFISRRFPKVYGCLYLILFFLLIIAGACLPYVYRRIVYSTAYEKEFTHGVIEKEITVEEEVAVKRRTTTMYTYFFEIDGHKVMVRPSDCRDYEVGDEFDFYVYSRNGKIRADSREYTFWQGILGLLAEVAIFYLAISYMRVDTGKSVERKKKAGENCEEASEQSALISVNYEQLSTKELYELCCKRNIKIITGKRNNREYLERCLRSDFDSKKSMAKWRKDREKEETVFDKIITVLIVVSLIALVCHYMKVVYHFIYLFT